MGDKELLAGIISGRDCANVPVETTRDRRKK